MDLTEYDVLINGVPHTVQYDDEDAKRLGLTVDEKARTPRNKAVKPNTK